MGAATYNWNIDQGSLATFQFQVKDDAGVPIDTTGLTGRGQIRTAPGSSVLVGALVVEVIDHTTGTWRVSCLPATLAGFSFGIRKSASDRVVCHYDVELYDALDVENVTRWLQGEARISVEVTK